MEGLAMAIVRPRLTDHHNILVTQARCDFAIPFLDEDIPLFVDPFLLWKSPSMQDTSLHTAMLAAFNDLGRLSIGSQKTVAREVLVNLSECPEVGLGQSRNKLGRRISASKAEEILALFESIPDIRKDGLHHIEAIQLLVDGIGKDRISDIACGLLKSFLIDYTTSQCTKLGIPVQSVQIDVYNSHTKKIEVETVELPVNPENSASILLAPKRWLRFSPWVGYDSYYEGAFTNLPPGLAPEKHRRTDVLNFNRQNYGLVAEYIEARKLAAADCHADPLFTQIPVTSAKSKLAAIKKLPTGTANGADKKYEGFIEQLLASLLYPHLDFAQAQSRTETGTHIRDMIFYNNRDLDFLSDMHRDYGATQLVFEIKNVRELESEHVNQLNRYLAGHFGRLGVIVTRHAPPKRVEKNIIDLWSGQRKCILVLTDSDLETMVAVFESKQRLPIEVLKRAFIDFLRRCPN